MFGSLTTSEKGHPKFDWSHSNAKINYPKGAYDPKGIFMYFENYNVEVSIRNLQLFSDRKLVAGYQTPANNYIVKSLSMEKTNASKFQ